MRKVGVRVCPNSTKQVSQSLTHDSKTYFWKHVQKTEANEDASPIAEQARDCYLVPYVLGIHKFAHFPGYEAKDNRHKAREDHDNYFGANKGQHFDVGFTFLIFQFVTDWWWQITADEIMLDMGLSELHALRLISDAL